MAFKTTLTVWGAGAAGVLFPAARASLQGAPFRGAALNEQVHTYTLAGGEPAWQPLGHRLLLEAPSGALPVHFRTMDL